jgi:hypothetical protein
VVLKRKKCTYGSGGVSNAYNYFHYYHSLGKVIKISTWIKILTMKCQQLWWGQPQALPIFFNIIGYHILYESLKLYPLFFPELLQDGAHVGIGECQHTRRLCRNGHCSIMLSPRIQPCEIPTVNSFCVVRENHLYFVQISDCSY